MQKRDRERKQQFELQAIEMLKSVLLSSGMTATDAEREIVKTHGKALGIPSVAALRKRIHRTKNV